MNFYEFMQIVKIEFGLGKYRQALIFWLSIYCRSYKKNLHDQAFFPQELVPVGDEVQVLKF